MTAAGPAFDWIKGWIDLQREAVLRWAGSETAALQESAGPFADLFSKLTDQLAGVPGFGATSQLPAWWRGFNPASGVAAGNPPGLGPLREHQMLAQDLAQAVAEYQRLAAEMTAALARIHSDTLDLLARRVAEQTNSGEPLRDFKGLYDLWIECGEAIYGKAAASDHYCRLQGELGNAGVRIQALQQQLLERWLKQLDLPTRSELDTLHRRVLQLQRRLDQAVSTAGSSAAATQPARAAPRAQRSRPKRTKS